MQGATIASAAAYSLLSQLFYFQFTDEGKENSHLLQRMSFSGIWHFVYRHLVVWQTCLTVCNCVVGTDILSSTLRRAGKTCGLGLGWVIFLRDSVKTSWLHSISPAPPSNSLPRVHTLPLISFIPSSFQLPPPPPRCDWERRGRIYMLPCR